MRTRWMTAAVAALALSAGAARADEPAENETISHGDRVEIRDHLANGYYTLLYFYADW